MLLPLRGVATPGHVEGEGAGANEVSGVLSEVSCAAAELRS